jgi:hypothetical protein
MFHNRGVVPEPRYTQDFDDLCTLYPDLDEVQSHLESELSENPRAGEPLPFAPDFRLYTTAAVGATPAFDILYTFDTRQVYLHSIYEHRREGE